MRTTLEGVLLTPLSIVATSGGDVMHAMKKSNVGYSGFGKVYLSQVEFGVIKSRKRHHEMILNLIVLVGAIHFVFDWSKK
jgi:dTDP-4-dehydrorhamnose 3,5-epimerase